MNYITGLLTKIGHESVVETESSKLKDVRCLPIGHEVAILPLTHLQQIDNEMAGMIRHLQKLEEKVGSEVAMTVREELKGGGAK